MKINLIEFKNYEISIHQEVSLVKEFKTILDKDKSKDKQQALNYFKYLYLCENPKSPYYDFLEEERHTYALKDSNLKDVPDYVLEAKTLYHTLIYNKPVLRMLESMKKAMKSMEEYFETVNFYAKIDSGPKKGALLYSPKELLDVMKNAHYIIDQVKALEKRALEELKEDAKVKGSQELGYKEQMLINE